jgi:hypothetical protein
MELYQTLFDDFAKMAALARINDHFAVHHSEGSVAGGNRVSKTRRA